MFALMILLFCGSSPLTFHTNCFVKALLVCLNTWRFVQAPFQPDQSDNKNWRFMTHPYIDFTSTNRSIPILPQPFTTNLANDEYGVGKKPTEAYNPLWKNPGVKNVGTGDSELVVVPFLPFFSSCRGFDSHIPIFRILEDVTNGDLEGSCNLTRAAKTRAINQWDPFNTPSQVRSLVPAT
jgi:hypothetical protein